MGSELLDSNGELFGHVHVVVNGRDFPFLTNAVDTVLSEKDKVDVFPAVGGGSDG
jgi:molybdopterin converting factor small subunit